MSEDRTPKAKQLVAMMQATMNLDLDEMMAAGVIDERGDTETSEWHKWNKDAPTFIIKLNARKLNALAGLIAHKWPSAFPPLADETHVIVPADYRKTVLEEAAKVCENVWWGESPDWWLNATKKDVSAKSCHECAAAIRALASQEKP